MIADGVGGAARGDLASMHRGAGDAAARRTRRGRRARGTRRRHPPRARPARRARRAGPRARRHQHHHHLGAVRRHRIGVAHVGDSRATCFATDALAAHPDHTFVQSLIDEGRITEEESRTHPHRNLILRAVDGVHETDPDLFYVDLAPGDRSCSAATALPASSTPSGSPTSSAPARSTSRWSSWSALRSTPAAPTTSPGRRRRRGGRHRAATRRVRGRGRGGGAATCGGHASKSFFRGHRGGDTGEIEPVPADPDAETVRRPGGAPLRAARPEARPVAPPPRSAPGADPGRRRRRRSSATAGASTSTTWRPPAARSRSTAASRPTCRASAHHVAETSGVTIAALPTASAGW